MIMGFFNRKKDADEIGAAYTDIMEQARNPVLYTGYGVPDTPAGRFQMIALHAAPVILGWQARNESARSQRLFDRIFKDIELSFREIGVGDLSIPKKMRAYMKDFNGLLQAHAEPGANHAAITARNVFNDPADMKDEFAGYINQLFKEGGAL